MKTEEYEKLLEGFKPNRYKTHIIKKKKDSELTDEDKAYIEKNKLHKKYKQQLYRKKYYKKNKEKLKEKALEKYKKISIQKIEKRIDILKQKACERKENMTLEEKLEIIERRMEVLQDEFNKLNLQREDIISQLI